jgi:hypothetical protein
MVGGLGFDHPFNVTPAQAGVPLPLGAGDQAGFPLSRE